MIHYGLRSEHSKHDTCPIHHTHVRLQPLTISSTEGSLKIPLQNRTYRILIGLLYCFLWPLYNQLSRNSLGSRSSDPASYSASIVCATVGTPLGLLQSIKSWLINNPEEIIVVTDGKSYRYITGVLESLTSSLHKTQFQLISCPRTNKRSQLCLGFNVCRSAIIIIADDDTLWSPTSLSAMTLPFKSSPTLGGVFPEVQIRPQTDSTSLTFWETLASIRLFGDAIDGRASVLLDGGVFCASGSTAAYRASILRDQAFQAMFQNEEWKERQLNAGDDQSLTRWMDRCGWDVLVMPDDGAGILGYGGASRRQGCRVETHVRPDWKHLGQLLRWSRSDWLANLWSVGSERFVWR